MDAPAAPEHPTMSPLTLGFGPLPRPTVTRTERDGVFAGSTEVDVTWGTRTWDRARGDNERIRIGADQVEAAVAQIEAAVVEHFPGTTKAQRRAVLSAFRKIVARPHTSRLGKSKDNVAPTFLSSFSLGMTVGERGSRSLSIAATGIAGETHTGRSLCEDGFHIFIGVRGGATTFTHRRAKRGTGRVTERNRGWNAWNRAFSGAW